jgi:DNA segregation ATPase FtsK/SpoIIIE, S-DNA-T family
MGLFLLGLSAFLFLSTISSMFSGTSDILLISSESTSIPANNIVGKLGALVGHYLVRNTFGFGFLAIPLIITMMGVKALTGKMILPFWKTTIWLLVAMVILPWSLGFFFYEKIPNSVEITMNIGDYIIGGASRFLLQTTDFYIAKTGNTIVLIVIAVGTLYMFYPGWHHKLGIIKNAVTFFLNIKEKIRENNTEEPPVGNTYTETTKTDDTSDIEVDELVSKKESPLEKISEVKSVTHKDNSDKNDKSEGLDLMVKEKQEEISLKNKEVKELTQELYDPTLELGSFKIPEPELLYNHGDGKHMVSTEELEINKDKIIDTLLNFNIEVDKIQAEVGPTVTLYEIVPSPGIRISKIKNLEDDIALSLAALGIRIIAPIPGRGTIGIEVPNSKPDVVSMLTLIRSKKFQNSKSKYELPIALGKNISNETYVFDLAKMPHLLMAGATGQGKSVGLNAILVSLLYSKHPRELKFVLVDPKKVELSVYNQISRHYLAQLPDAEDAIITDTDKVVITLNSLCKEMDQRYDLLKDAQCRNLKEYNQKFRTRKIIPDTCMDLHPERGHHYLPYIVLVIDEFADLIMTAGKEVETPIARLAQLARAIGIHLIIATQRPSVNIITGTIKANFPARVAFRVTSKIDSRTILDAGGADQLIGRGDMLMSTGNDLIRLQCGFVDTPEVEAICNYIGGQRGFDQVFELPEFVSEGAADRGATSIEERDKLFEEAAHLIVMHQQGSTSLLQRKLKLGYNRAGRLVDQLEDAGIIGPFEGSKARKVLVPDAVSLEQILQRSFNDEE